MRKGKQEEGEVMDGRLHRERNEKESKRMMLTKERKREYESKKRGIDGELRKR